VKTIRSLPVTVPPENVTTAETRGRCGSGGAYDDGHDSAVVAEGLTGAVDGAAFVTATDGCSGEGVRPDSGVADVQAAARRAATSQPVRTGRR
jgi:hypothetical protein